ncbi:uncharacterized protein BX663DRAFT_487412 [Cokeromyces recurvatus]|uniref:uncharacterized protein n=1 Tax=Cokeromyces recurvatus TaxID=90255 RepID=UPI0022204CC6|nr:uncharacterized protein BX663DRAFT_487412 [Cokeromyces recurvatus]KAI7901702.1 hypothetical protein BX663DRAFT_487412 [Cokeromyces recurvatus]
MEATLVTLSKQIQSFVPLLSSYEAEHAGHKPYDVRRLPFATTVWFISQSIDALSVYNHEYQRYMCISFTVAYQGIIMTNSKYFNMFNDLEPNGNNDVLFSRKSVFTTAGVSSIQKHALTRCTTKEYYHYTGPTKYAAKQTKLKKEQGF